MCDSNVSFILLRKHYLFFFGGLGVSVELVFFSASSYKILPFTIKTSTAFILHKLLTFSVYNLDAYL